MSDRTVRVRLEAIVGPYQRAMVEAAMATEKLSKEQQKANQVMSNMGRTMQHVGAGMTIGLTAPLLLLAKASTDVAMTAQETANRVTVAFGEQEAALHMWSEGSAHSMGLARHEAEGTAATFDTMFTEMGLGRSKAYDLSTGIVQLAADVGSFRDVDPTEMLEKMRAGVVGEYEPLRNLGIVLTDVGVRQEAVRMGLAESTDEVTTAGLVQARYSLILKQTSKDQGDYARTADSATNASRTARAAFTDAMKELGDNFIPLVAQGAEIVTALAEAFQNLGPAGQTAILVFAGLVAVAGPAIFVTGSLIRNLETIEAVAPAAAAGLRGVSLAAGGIGAVLAIVTTAIALFGNQQHEAATDVAALTQALDQQVETLGDSLNAWAAQAIVSNNLDKFAKQAKISLDIVARAILGDEAAMAQLQTAYENLGLQSNLEGATDADRRHADAAHDLLEGVRSLNGEFETEQGKATRTRVAMAALTDDTEEVADSTETAADAVDKFNKSLDELFAKTFSVQEATDQFTQDLADFADEVMAAKEAGDANAASLSEGTITGLKNREMLRGLAEDALNVAAAMKEQGAAPEEIAAAMQSYRAAILNVINDLGVSGAQAEGFVNLLLQIDGIHAQPTVTLNAEDAAKQLDDLLMKLWAMQTGGDALGAIVADIIGQATGTGSVAHAPAVQHAVSGQGPKATSARSSQASDPGAYLRSLHEQEEEAKRAAEAVQSYLRALYEHQMELEDNMYRFDAMSKDRYLQILEERLAGLEKYSDAWAKVMDQIRAVREEALDMELKVIEAYEAGRMFQQSWDALASQRTLYPATVSGSGSSTYSSTTWAPTFNAYGSDSQQALATQNQKLRDLASVM